MDRCDREAAVLLRGMAYYWAWGASASFPQLQPRIFWQQIPPISAVAQSRHSSTPSEGPGQASRFSDIPLPKTIVDPEAPAFTIEQTNGAGAVLHFVPEPELSEDCRGSFTLLTMMPPFAKRWNVD